MPWKKDFRDIERQRQGLMDAALRLLPDSVEVIRAAVEFATRAHEGQTRDEGDPYVIHPIRAALFMIEEMEERDPNVIAAILLHDVVEDTSATLEEIRQKFGDRVARLVESVTRPRAKLETEEDKLKTKPAAYQKILHASDETIRIKAADLLDNMRSWEMVEELVRSNPVRLARWLNEARAYYFEIGKRAGHGVEQEMRRIAISSSLHLFISRSHKHRCRSRADLLQ